MKTSGFQTFLLTTDAERRGILTINQKKMIQIIRSTQQQVIDRGKFIIRLFALGNELKDRNDHGLYQLGRVDHATLEKGMLVPMHLHHNDEILSYMRKGKMMHKDNQGNNIEIHNQYLMMMNAGTGFYHEESVPQDSETVEMLQIFMRPRADELKAQVQFHHFEEMYSINKWRLIGANETSNAPLKINADIQILDLRLQNTARMALPLHLTTNQVAYLYVFDGSIYNPDTKQNLKKGDALIVENKNITITTEEYADIVLFILDKTSKVSRNGLYAK